MATSDFSSRSKRADLGRGSDWTETIYPGLYLVYRRGPGPAKAGTWRARRRREASTSYETTPIGVADDLVDADGAEVLAYEQARERARVWAEEQRRAATRVAAMGAPVGDPVCGDALDYYLANLKKRGRPTATAESIIRAHLRPAWGSMKVSALAKPGIQAWLMALAEAPRRVTGQNYCAEGAWGEDGPTEEQLRARKVTANRIFAVFTAAMNLAAADGMVPDDPAPWRSVHQFSGAKKARLRFLDVEEQRDLVHDCDTDYADLVQSALHTGSRLGPLMRLQAGDFNERAGTIHIVQDKGGKARHVVLAAEGLAFFKQVARGKRSTDLMFRRADGAVWTKEMSQDLIRAACVKAGIEPLTFHELRHTYASGLVNAGVPLKFVAQQLGHRDTRMVEEHYGHLSPTAVADSIRALTPKLGLGGEKRN